MTTVKDLLHSIRTHLDSGDLDLDSNVYMTPDMIPTGDSMFFSCTACVTNEPRLDWNNMTKKAFFICGLGRAPNAVIDNSEFYGDLELNKRMPRAKKDKLISEHDWATIMENHKRAENESERSYVCQGAAF